MINLNRMLFFITLLFFSACGDASPNGEASTDSEDSETADTDADTNSDSDADTDMDTDTDSDTDVYVPQSCEGEVVFRDTALETSVRKMINWSLLGGQRDTVYSGTVTGEQTGQLTYLDFAVEAGISSLEGIECLKNADTLRLDGNNIKDISLLGLLPKLSELHLTYNLITDISSLENMSSLRKIYLSGNPLEDASPLAGLVSLEYVTINETNVRTLDWISDLHNLSLLFAEGNGISDISPLAGLGNLGAIKLGDNAIRDLSAFDSVRKESVASLWLENNQIEDISPLVGIHPENAFDLSGNQIEDISPLGDSESGLVGLHKLYLNGNRIRDISVLADLGYFSTEVTLWDNQIEDLSPLVGTAVAEETTYWNLSNNRISDLSPLASFGALRDLDVSDNEIKDLGPLKGMGLRTLKAARNQIHDLSPLLADSVYSGETLDLTDNRVVSVNPLASIAKVSPNGVPLYVFLSGNPLGEFALTEDIPTLCDIERSEIFWGDGETCAWNTEPSVGIPAYTYPAEPFDEIEPEKTEDCDAAPFWLTDGSLPGESHGGVDFKVDNPAANEPVVADTVTGLFWRPCSEGQTWDGTACVGDVVAVQPGELTDACTDPYGGYDDWRRPNMTELNTLVRYDLSYPGPVIDEGTFPDTYPGNYWTVDSPPYVWLNFYNGTASLAASTPGRIRCVRGGGDTLPDTRFTLTDNETVLDTTTSLEWQQCAVGQALLDGICTGIGETMSFSAAESACTGDFRLPTVTELFSLVNPCGADPAAYTAAFPGTPPALFWSDTSFPDLDSKRWAVYFGVGSTEPLLTDSAARVRCVR